LFQKIGGRIKRWSEQGRQDGRGERGEAVQRGGREVIIRTGRHDGETKNVSAVHGVTKDVLRRPGPGKWRVAEVGVAGPVTDQQREQKEATKPHGHRSVPPLGVAEVPQGIIAYQLFEK
jgi:hypothetical protein